MNNYLGNLSKEADGYKMVFDRTLNHPIEKVWDAITNPEQMKYWFTDVDMDFRAGGKMTIKFRDAGKTESPGEVVSIDPPHRFVWTWEGELAEWELTSIDEHTTQLKFSYSRQAAEHTMGTGAGFHTLLERLEHRLEGSDTIYPFGTENTSEEHVKMKVRYATAIYEQHPEVLTTQPVVVEKMYNATIDRVWSALTSKDEMRIWYFNVDDFRLEEGFEFRFSGQGHDCDQYMHICTITDIIPGRKIQYSWQYEGYPGYSIVTFELFEEGDKTRLKLVHHGLETFPQDKPDFAWGSFNEGWTWFTQQRLPEYLEKGTVSSAL